MNAARLGGPTGADGLERSPRRGAPGELVEAEVAVHRRGGAADDLDVAPARRDEDLPVRPTRARAEVEVQAVAVSLGAARDPRAPGVARDEPEAVLVLGRLEARVVVPLEPLLLLPPALDGQIRGEPPRLAGGQDVQAVGRGRLAVVVPGPSLALLGALGAQRGLDLPQVRAAGAGPQDRAEAAGRSDDAAPGVFDALIVVPQRRSA